MTKHTEQPRIIFCSERAYGIALMIEKYAAKYDRGTPMDIARSQIIDAHQAGSGEGVALMLDVYDILIARHCTDGNVRFIWEIDDEACPGNDCRDLSDIGRDLDGELDKLCAAVSSMMDEAQALDAGECQKVTLALPKALVFFALYRSLFEKAEGSGALWWEISKGLRSPDDRLCVHHRNRFLEGVLTEYLEEEFHWFATRGHPLLYADPGEAGEGSPV